MDSTHKGCAFVVYNDENAANKAIDELHEKYMFPEATNLLQVRYADGVPERSNKIFVGMLPKLYTETELFEMFSPFGVLKEVHVIRGNDGSSKGCGFVKYIEYESAVAAIYSLHGSLPHGSSKPIVVKFADKKHNLVHQIMQQGKPSTTSFSIQELNIFTFQKHKLPLKLYIHICRHKD